MFSNLKTVLMYLITQIDKHQLVQLHEKLGNLFEEARTSPSAEVTENINATRNLIHDAQIEIEPQGWDFINLKIFEEFGSTAVLGVKGFNRLEEELRVHANDPHGAYEKAIGFAADITRLKSRAEQSINSLAPLLSDQKEFPKDKKVVQLIFKHRVAVEKVSSLVVQAKEWDTIIKLLLKTLDEPEAEVEIYRINKSSPLIIEIVAGVSLAIVLIPVVAKVLDIVEKILNIIKLAKEIELADLDKEIKLQTLDLMKQQQEKTLDQLINEKVEELKSELEMKLNSEKENALRFGILKVYNFTVQGGSVNVIDTNEVSETEPTFNNLKQLSTVYKKVDKLLQKNEEVLKLAEFSTQDNETLKSLLNKPKGKKQVKE